MSRSPEYIRSSSVKDRCGNSKSVGAETSIDLNSPGAIFPAIVADAAYHILMRDSKECTGNYFIDEEVLLEEGETDLDKYSVVPGAELMSDFFI